MTFFRIVRIIYDFIWVCTLKSSIDSHSNIYFKISLLIILEMLVTYLKTIIFKKYI